jgi:chemotaxis protein MotB
MSRRRKRHEEEHDNLDRWLVSYADFITLLFAFFVVMYALSSVNEGKYRVMSTAIVEAFRTGNELSIIKSPATGAANTQIKMPHDKPNTKAIKGTEQREKEKQDKLTKDILKAMDPLVKGGQVNVKQTPEGIAVEIKDSALFQVGQAKISAVAAQSLAGVATVLSAADNLVRVEGFTDNVPIKNPVYPSNWELSAARAGSVVRLFAEGGVAANRMIAIGRAENRPIASNDTDAGRAQNRRVSITILAGNKEEIDVVPMDTFTQSGGQPAARPAP